MIIPALLVVMLAILTFGMWFFSVGRAAIFSTEAQTAADAAALAAVKDVRTQLMEQVALTGTSDLALINPLRVRAAAESYAQRNKAHVTRLERRGVDVKVWVSTNAKLGERAEELGQEDTRGEGRARARLDLIAVPGFGAGQHRRDRHRRGQEDLRQGLEGARQGDLEPAPVRDGRLLQRPGQALGAARGARLHGRRERRLRRQPAARVTLRHRLPLPVPQLRRDRRQRLRGGGEARHRRHRQRGPGARLPHDLAGGRAL